MSDYEKGPRTIEQYREALSRMCDAAWNRKTSTVFTIPPDAERDADLVLSDAITEVERLREIVRDLAAREPWDGDDKWRTCLLCGGEAFGVDAVGGVDVDDHRESCPWRRAREVTNG